MFGHFGFNGVISGAVVEHLVDDVALGAREAGDFAGGFAASGFEDGGRGLRDWLSLGIHGNEGLNFNL